MARFEVKTYITNMNKRVTSREKNIQCIEEERRTIKSTAEKNYSSAVLQFVELQVESLNF